MSFHIIIFSLLITHLCLLFSLVIFSLFLSIILFRSRHLLEGKTRSRKKCRGSQGIIFARDSFTSMTGAPANQPPRGKGLEAQPEKKLVIPNTSFWASRVVPSLGPFLLLSFVHLILCSLFSLFLSSILLLSSLQTTDRSSPFLLSSTFLSFPLFSLPLIHVHFPLLPCLHLPFLLFPVYTLLSSPSPLPFHPLSRISSRDKSVIF